MIRSSNTNSYKHLITKIEYRGSTLEINLWTGVKQGDPLSTYAFNAIMTPLLEQLEALKGTRLTKPILYLLSPSQMI